MITPQETLERALTLSKANACVVIADELSSVNLRWANNTLTTNGVTHNQLLTVIAIVDGAAGKSVGVVTQNGVTTEGLEQLIRTAEAVARASAVAEDAQPLLTGCTTSPNWDKPSIGSSIEVFSSFATDLGAALARSRSEDRLLFGYAQHTARSTYIASSTGLCLRHDQPCGYVEINARSRDHTSSAWTSTASVDFTDVSVAALDAQLTQRLGWAKRRVELAAGRYEVLLPPSAVADLMLHLYASAGARHAHEGRSVFSKPGGGTGVGQRITSAQVTLRSDPHAAGLECAPFVVAYNSDDITSVFDNGLPLKPTLWIADGTLSALVQTRHSARLCGLPVTPKINNLIMSGPPGGRTLKEMVAHTTRGLLLTCLWYIREVDPQTLLLTGLTRDGVFLVESGEIVGEVNNFRFNESPVELLRRIVEVGVTEQTLARERSDDFIPTAMPTLRIADFNMSTVSHAL